MSLHDGYKKGPPAVFQNILDARAKQEYEQCKREAEPSNALGIFVLGLGLLLLVIIWGGY